MRNHRLDRAYLDHGIFGVLSVFCLLRVGPRSISPLAAISSSVQGLRSSSISHSGQSGLGERDFGGVFCTEGRERPAAEGPAEGIITGGRRREGGGGAEVEGCDELPRRLRAVLTFRVVTPGRKGLSKASFSRLTLVCARPGH